MSSCRTVGAYKANNLAIAHREGHAVEGADPAKVLDDISGVHLLPGVAQLPDGPGITVTATRASAFAISATALLLRGRLRLWRCPVGEPNPRLVEPLVRLPPSHDAVAPVDEIRSVIVASTICWSPLTTGTDIPKKLPCSNFEQDLRQSGDKRRPNHSARGSRHAANHQHGECGEYLRVVNCVGPNARLN